MKEETTPVGMMPRVALLLFSLATNSTVTIHFGSALEQTVIIHATALVQRSIAGISSPVEQPKHCTGRGFAFKSTRHTFQVRVTVARADNCSIVPMLLVYAFHCKSIPIPNKMSRQLSQA